MNIWKPANKKIKKVTAQENVWPDEAAAVLPDVVSGLSLADTDMMIGQNSHWSDTGGRHRRTNQPITPVGLGAGLPMTPQDLGVIPAPPIAGSSWRQDLSGAWYQPTFQTVDNNWAQTVLPISNSVDSHAKSGVCLAANKHIYEIDGARLRSMSSDNHTRTNDCHQTNRKSRCSSATRSKQNRPRRADSQVRNQGNFATANQVLSSSPPPRPVFATICRDGRAREFISVDDNRETSAVPSNLPIPGGFYGYKVSNLEALLTEATRTRPANLPMVLASPTRLHSTRMVQEAPEASAWPFLPLGIIVNAVFKTRDWLYIRTAHGAEGYVPYGVCLPLGILPPSHVSQHHLGCNGPWEIRRGSDVTETLRHPKPSTSSENQERGRSRYRRRIASENTNQTDLQKLRPGFDIRPPRETLDNPMSGGTSYLV